MDQDLAGDQRVAAVTWVAITEDTVMADTEGEDAGEVVLHLMRSYPSAVASDFMNWILSRRTRMESAVKALMDPHVADRLKEGYLNYVTYYATDTGFYFMADTDIEIREVVEDAES